MGKERIEYKCVKFITVLTTSLLIFNLLFILPITVNVEAGNIVSFNDNSTYLSLTTPEEEPPPPPPPPPPPAPTFMIYRYDLINKTGHSKLNAQIDVNQEHKFSLCIINDQDWDQVEFINIKAWYDHGDDSITYDDDLSLGGNIKMFLQYENLSGEAHYNMLWPDDEVTKGVITESIGRLSGVECRNITLSFKPGYQFRYAPGDGSWDKSKNAINDRFSWNFEITVIDRGNNITGPRTIKKVDEFGVNSYTEIASTGLLYIQGLPGENASTDSNVTVSMRSNLGHSLSVDIDTLYHEVHPIANISNKTMWVRGGDIQNFTHFTGKGPIYFYGSSTTYAEPDDNEPTKIIDNLEYKMNIPMAQLPGDYSGQMFYKLKAQI